MSQVFNGLEMSYIEGGHTPNLLSLGRALKGGKVAIFTEHGAARLKSTPQIDKMIKTILRIGEQAGLIEGTAKVENYVYKEDFTTRTSPPPAAHPAATALAESTCAVTVSMYAGRVKLGNEANTIRFMVAAGFTKTALLSGIKNQNVKGMPPVITKEGVEHYFEHVGKDEPQLEAEITRAPLRKPLDYAPLTTNTPGEIVEIDNIDPSFSRTRSMEPMDESQKKPPAYKKVVEAIGGYKDAVLAVDVATGIVAPIGRAPPRRTRI